MIKTRCTEQNPSKNKDGMKTPITKEKTQGKPYKQSGEGEDRLSGAEDKLQELGHEDKEYEKLKHKNMQGLRDNMKTSHMGLERWPTHLTWW